MEGDLGWVLQGSAFTCFISSTSSQRPEKFGQFCLYMLAISTPKKRGIAKQLILTIRAIMIGQHVGLVAGDFNGTAWRCSNGNNISTIDEAFADCALPTPPGPTPLWGPGSIPNNWADVCGFLRPPDSDRYWKVRIRRCFLHPTQNSRPAPNRSKLPPRDTAPPSIRRLAQHSITS